MLRYIYGLVDPRTNGVRYVGQTNKRPEIRMRGHMCGGYPHQTHSPASAWIRELRDKGLKPRVVELDYIKDEGPRNHPLANQLEREWINKGVALGWDLTNVSGRKNLLGAGDASCLICERTIQIMHGAQPFDHLDLCMKTVCCTWCRHQMWDCLLPKHLAGRCRALPECLRPWVDENVLLVENGGGAEYKFAWDVSQWDRPMMKLPWDWDRDRRGEPRERGEWLPRAFRGET